MRSFDWLDGYMLGINVAATVMLILALVQWVSA